MSNGLFRLIRTTAYSVLFLSSLLGFWAWVLSPAWSQERVDTALVLIADVSSSMDTDEVRIARESHALAISSREVITAIEAGPYQRIAVAYVEFANTAEVVVGWTIIDSAASAQAFARAIVENAQEPPNLGVMTGIGGALSVALQLFDEAPFEALWRTVDVASDGKNNRSPNVALPRSMLLDQGITINGLPMTLRPSQHGLVDYFETQIIGGPRAFSIELRRIEDMPMAIRRKLILEIGAASSAGRAA